MKSYEALQKCIKGDTVETAKELGLSTISVNKWQEPHTDFTDSGSFNPLDRINTIINRSVRKGKTADEAYAPLYYLAEEHKHVCIPLPECKCLDDLNRELHESIKEFGHMVSAASEAMLDGRISRMEFKRIEDEGNDLIRHVSAFIIKAKESIK
jgi:hypothetical protein